MLKQTALYEDFLYQFEDAIQRISRENDFIVCQILIWSIINYVPLLHFKPGQICVRFYEDILTNPNDEIAKIDQFINLNDKEHQMNIDEVIINRPSFVTDKTKEQLTKKSLLTSWKNELSAQQIDAGFRTLRLFGFENLYTDSGMPNHQLLDKIHRKT